MMALMSHQASVENLLVKERHVKKKEETSGGLRKNRLADEANRRWQEHQQQKQKQDEQNDQKDKSIVTDDSNVRPRRSRRIDIKSHGYDDLTLQRARSSVDRVLTGSFVPRATVAEEMRAK